MGVKRSLGIWKIVLAQENKATHGIMATHWIIPHGIAPN
jgi:hypothetical protein